jgi:1,4-alpha-glucan branching enzyme
MPKGGDYDVIFNSDDIQFYGSNSSELRKYTTKNIARNKNEYSVDLKLPPLSVIVLKPKKKTTKSTTLKSSENKIKDKNK